MVLENLSVSFLSVLLLCGRIPIKLKTKQTINTQPNQTPLDVDFQTTKARFLNLLVDYQNNFLGLCTYEVDQNNTY